MKLIPNIVLAFLGLSTLAACGGGSGDSGGTPSSSSVASSVASSTSSASSSSSSSVASSSSSSSAASSSSSSSAAGSYTVGGTVSGLGTGSSLVLRNNGGDARTVTADGAFTFATPLATGAAYAVTIATQPAGKSCLVTNAAGSVGTGNVTTVAIACAIAGCSSSASAPSYTSDPVWAAYSAPTGAASTTTPVLYAELPNPFALCLNSN